MTATDNGRLSERDQRIWDGYVGGKTILVLAKEHDLSHQRISQILQEIRASLPPHDRQAIIDLRVDQIAQGINGVMPGLITGDKDAIASWKILSEREAKYLGLDAAEKVQISGGVRYEIAGLDDGE